MEAGSLLIDKKIKQIFLIFIALIALISIYPILPQIKSEHLTELGILNADGKISNYPREVKVDEKINLFIYLSNYEGSARYYKVQAKIVNDPIQISKSPPFNAPVIDTWEIFLNDGENATIPISLSIAKEGVNLKLIFELYTYQIDSSSFIFNNRWVQLWMNVSKTT